MRIVKEIIFLISISSIIPFIILYGIDRQASADDIANHKIPQNCVFESNCKL